MGGGKSSTPRSTRKRKKTLSPEARQKNARASTSAGRTSVTKTESTLMKMVTRCASGVAMFSALGFTLYAGHIFLSCVLVLLQVEAFKELVNLRYVEAKEKSMPHFRSLQWAWFAVAMFYAHGSSWLKAPMGIDEAVFNKLFDQLQHFVPLTNQTAFFDFVAFGLFILVFVLSVLSLRKGLYDYQITQFTWTGMALCIVVLQMKTVTHNIYQGMFWFLFPFLCVAVNDISAYFAGVALGKKIFKQPFLALSPKKTWEGFLGAFVGTMIFAYWCSPALGRMYGWGCTYAEVQSNAQSCQMDSLFAIDEETGRAPIRLHAMAIASFASLVAPFGGFLASGLKRATGIKDFHNIFPGHGGVMDRMDCQFFMCLFVHIYCSTFVYDPLSPVYEQAKMLSMKDQQRLVAALSR